MSAIQNLQTFDPFADATKGDDRLPAGTEDYIHIRIQQRNGRKTLTTVQGIAADYDKKKLVKAFKKKFACNGTVIEHPEYGEVIQLQGDQRKNICQFLIEVSSSSTFPLGLIQAGVLISSHLCRLTWRRRSSSRFTAFRSCQQPSPSSPERPSSAPLLPPMCCCCSSSPLFPICNTTSFY
uniref:Eukaryotic translation initiation factor 1 n=1 Tax=Oryzias melastigma TaxID=30732 RepID=A0A3B3CBC4_ORYME